MEVAIKVLRAQAQDLAADKRLRQEAEILAKLRHTAVVQVFDVVQVAGYGTGVVMEVLRGRELREELLELESSGQRMPIPDVLGTFAPIVETLEAARELEIVHRDVKPENIFLIHAAYGGGVRLLDFGLARTGKQLRFTQEGVVAGSPSHIAPEAWAGHDALDHRADVYALGVVLFRVLGGQNPFGPPDDFVALARAVTRGPRPSLRALRPDLPPAIDGWVEHALAIDPDRRFARATALWNALKGCLAAQGV
jgi:serine/threonine-protein kinase